jgi:transposase
MAVRHGRGPGALVAGERVQLSKHAEVAKAIDYLLSPNHWPGLHPLSRGRPNLPDQQCRRTRARGRGPRPEVLALRRRARFGQREATMSKVIGTAKVNGIDPLAWLACIARIADMPVSRLPELLP